MIDNTKVDKGFDVIDKAYNTAVNDLKLNYFEILHITAMMDMKIRQQNINGYLLETVTRFAQEQNEQDAGV